MKLITTLLLIAKAIATSDLVVSSDRLTEGSYEVVTGSATIDQGITWNIFDVPYVWIDGDFTNNGNFYLSTDSNSRPIYFEIYAPGNHAVNNGLMVVNSGQSIVCPTFKINGGQFENNGKMFFTGNGKTGSISQICPNTFHNNGLIALYQNQRTTGLVDLGQLWQSFTNDGTVCLQNQAFDQQSAIYGTGCFDIGKDSTVWIKTASLPIEQTQSFFFSSTGGAIKVEAVSASQTFTINNWGGDNILGLSLPITKYSYNGAGILTLSSGVFSFNFNIGPGYDINKMKKVTANYGAGIGSVINGGIVYTGTTPNTNRPAVCAVCESAPAIPSP